MNSDIGTCIPHSMWEHIVEISESKSEAEVYEFCRSEEQLPEILSHCDALLEAAQRFFKTKSASKLGEFAAFFKTQKPAYAAAKSFVELWALVLADMTVALQVTSEMMLQDAETQTQSGSTSSSESEQEASAAEASSVEGSSSEEESEMEEADGDDCPCGQCTCGEDSASESDAAAPVVDEASSDAGSEEECACGSDCECACEGEEDEECDCGHCDEIDEAMCDGEEEETATGCKCCGDRACDGESSSSDDENSEDEKGSVVVEEHPCHCECGTCEAMEVAKAQRHPALCDCDATAAAVTEEDEEMMDDDETMFMLSPVTRAVVRDIALSVAEQSSVPTEVVVAICGDVSEFEDVHDCLDFLTSELRVRAALEAHLGDEAMMACEEVLERCGNPCVQFDNIDNAAVIMDAFGPLSEFLVLVADQLVQEESPVGLWLKIKTLIARAIGVAVADSESDSESDSSDSEEEEEETCACHH